MDIRLPDLNGNKAAVAIKKIKKELPIIAQTAHAMEEDKINSFEAGCDEFITKPIDKKKLLRLIDKYL